jgi:hypothetical protein
MFGKGSLGETGIQEAQIKAPEVISQVAPAQEKRSRYSTVFDGPAYTLPPVDLLFDKFLSDFLSLSTAPTDASVASASNASAALNDAGYADSVTASVDLESTLAEVKAAEEMMVLPGGGIGDKAKRVGDKEVEELAGWFRDVLSAREYSPLACKAESRFLIRLPSLTQPRARHYRLPR